MRWPIALALVGSFAMTSSSTTLVRRTDGEHVVLADCRDANNVLSSQMAYFPGAPSSSPQDVAIVNAPSGQTALWASSTTAALFTTTGVTFTAVLGPKVANGSYAGTGNNTYTGFTCWQRYVLNLYKYGNTTCSQVYDCDHEVAPAPSSSSSSSVSSTSAPTASSTSSSSDNSASPTPSPKKSSGLSTGAIGGIVVGIVGAAIIAAVAALILLRKRRGRNEAAELQGDGHAVHEKPLKHRSATHELDGQWQPPEAYGQSRPAELGE